MVRADQIPPQLSPDPCRPHRGSTTAETLRRSGLLKGGRRVGGRSFERLAEEMRGIGVWAFTIVAWISCCSASAQDTSAQEAARRAMVLAQLPPDAAKVLFG